MSQPFGNMIQAQKSPDLLIVGAGIFGLWAARHAIKAEKSVVVLEKRDVGAGASGGFMGALMPHMPERWDAKIEMQFNALCELPRQLAELEADTGLACGFRRCGRLVPLVHEDTRIVVAQRIASAAEHWQGKFAMELIERSDIFRFSEWLDPAGAPFGAQWEDMSARIDPRAYLDALAAYARAHGEIRSGAGVARLEPKTRSVVLENGERISAGEICVAAGWESYQLLQPFMGKLNRGKTIGRGVKGQAMLLEFPHNDREPILFHDGAYVIPQRASRVATGSTSINSWQDGEHREPESFDPGNVGFHEKAVALAPILRDAPVVEKWAGVRPRNTFERVGNAPFLAPVPGFEGLSARIGGFKIGLGIGGVKTFNAK